MPFNVPLVPSTTDTTWTTASCLQRKSRICATGQLGRASLKHREDRSKQTRKNTDTCRHRRATPTSESCEKELKKLGALNLCPSKATSLHSYYMDFACRRTYLPAESELRESKPCRAEVTQTMMSLDRIMLPVLAKGKMKNSVSRPAKSFETRLTLPPWRQCLKES